MIIRSITRRASTSVDTFKVTPGKLQANTCLIHFYKRYIELAEADKEPVDEEEEVDDAVDDIGT